MEEVNHRVEDEEQLDQAMVEKGCKEEMDVQDPRLTSFLSCSNFHFGLTASTSPSHASHLKPDSPLP